MAPEGACNSANEWLTLMLCDVVWVGQSLPDRVGSSRYESHWASGSTAVTRGLSSVTQTSEKEDGLERTSSFINFWSIY